MKKTLLARLLFTLLILLVAAWGWADTSCTVTRNCQYGNPITCGSTAGSCSSGPDQNGWVQCDGNITYCPPPPICEGDGVCNPDCDADPDCGSGGGLCEQVTNCHSNLDCHGGVCTRSGICLCPD
jgi:hypothetical protein